jgi:N-ethylmaleimide reductase
MENKSGILNKKFQLGGVRLANRIVMAPMARGRAGEDNVPGALMAEYYAQRADAGLIIAEASAVSPEGRNTHRCAAIYNETHIKGWKKVTDEVHARGGKIFLQLLHAGRATHTETIGQQPLAPSPIGAKTKTFTSLGFTECSTPRALSYNEIEGIISSFASCARNALEAGFDGIELHAANGYLPDQFLKDGTNQREDQYGGSIEKRLRFVLELVDATLVSVPGFPVGIRISPSAAQDAGDSNPQALFVALLEELAQRRLVYVHAVEGVASGTTEDRLVDHRSLRTRFPGPWITNNGYRFRAAESALEEGRADLIAFGRPFISNPDLVSRILLGQMLAEVDKKYLFCGEEKGYTDYLTFADSSLSKPTAP